jgi:hypothetical protein
MYVLSRVYGSVTNNNGFWNRWLDLLLAHSLLIRINYAHNKWLPKTRSILVLPLNSDPSLSLVLRPTISRPICPRIKHSSGVYDHILIAVRQLRVSSCGTLSLTVVYNVAGPRQHSHSRVRTPWDSWPYFTVSDSRLPFRSLPTTRRATVEVFDPASTRENLWFDYVLYHLYSLEAHPQKTHALPSNGYMRTI